MRDTIDIALRNTTSVSIRSIVLRRVCVMQYLARPERRLSNYRGIRRHLDYFLLKAY